MNEVLTDEVLTDKAYVGATFRYTGPACWLQMNEAGEPCLEPVDLPDDTYRIGAIQGGEEYDEWIFAVNHCNRFDAGFLALRVLTGEQLRNAEFVTEDFAESFEPVISPEYFDTRVDHKLDLDVTQEVDATLTPGA